MQAAEQENGDAVQCKLSSMFTNSQGAPQDIKEAMRWYTKAAEQGNAYA